MAESLWFKFYNMFMNSLFVYFIISYFLSEQQHGSIEILTGNNYKEWKKHIGFALGIADINMALREAINVLHLISALYDFFIKEIL